MDERARILIVEDRSIVAAKVKRELEAAGFAIAGMAANLMAAIDLARRIPIDAAVLDIDLRGEPVYPVAEILRGRDIPFLFLTGFSQVAVAAPWQRVPLVEKPFAADTLVRALRATIAGERSVAPDRRMFTPAIRTAWEVARHSRDLVTEQRAWSEQHGSPLRRG